MPVCKVEKEKMFLTTGIRFLLFAYNSVGSKVSSIFQLLVCLDNDCYIEISIDVSLLLARRGRQFSSWFVLSEGCHGSAVDHPGSFSVSIQVQVAVVIKFIYEINRWSK